MSRLDARRPLGWLALSAALAGWACGRALPAGPDLTSASAPVAAAVSESGARASAASDDGNRPPTAVFRTRPPADSEGVIAGGTSFEVTFNLCQSVDHDAGDELRFTFDFDGNGGVDALGHCRATRRYAAAPFETVCVDAVACVTDRQPDHKICRTYQVCANGRAKEPEPSGPPAPEVFTEQRIAGDFIPIASRDVWAFRAQADTEVTLELDTVSEDTAYWMLGCISTSSRWVDCIPPVTSGRVDCSYPPPGGLGCPRRTTRLPQNPGDTYYLIVGGVLFTRDPGQYTAVVRTNPGIGALGLIIDNGDSPTDIFDP
jgi:hypothetical protein